MRLLVLATSERAVCKALKSFSRSTTSVESFASTTQLNFADVKISLFVPYTVISHSSVVATERISAVSSATITLSTIEQSLRAIVLFAFLSHTVSVTRSLLSTIGLLSAVRTMSIYLDLSSYCFAMIVLVLFCALTLRVNA